MKLQSILPDGPDIPTISDKYHEDFQGAMSQHRPMIYRFLLTSSRDVDLAETLTQECFLRTFRKWSSFRGEAKLSTWLMRIAINLQRDYWRSRRMQFWNRARAHSLDTDDVLHFVPVSSDSPERSAIAKEQVRLIWKIVSKLNEKQRTVFLLRVVEEFKLSEIADATGMPLGSIKANLHRSMSQIRKAFETRAQCAEAGVIIAEATTTPLNSTSAYNALPSAQHK